MRSRATRTARAVCLVSSGRSASGACVGMPVGRRPMYARRNAKTSGCGNLGAIPSSSVERIEEAHDPECDLGRDVAGSVRVAREHARVGRALPGDAAQQVTCSLLVGGVGALGGVGREQHGAVGGEELLDALQRLEHLLGREIRGAGDNVPVGREEGRGRPAAHVVPAVHVGAPVVVDANGQVIPVDDGYDLLVGVARLVHDVAPVAPDRREREQDGAPETVSLGEGSLAPRAPLDLVGAVGAWREAEVGVRCHGPDIPGGRDGESQSASRQDSAGRGWFCRQESALPMPALSRG